MSEKKEMDSLLALEQEAKEYLQHGEQEKAISKLQYILFRYGVLQTELSISHMNHVFSGWSQANYKPEASLEPDLILYAECTNRIFRLTKQLAEEFGLVDYQYNLGKLFMEEPGFSDCADQFSFVWKKDMSKAAHWFEKAANQGHAEAMEALGAILFDDHPEQAKLWYEKAFAAGSQFALIGLGNRYYNSDQFDAALECYQKAYQAGDLVGLKRIIKYYLENDKQEHAADWIRKLAEEAEKLENRDPLRSLYFRDAGKFFSEIKDTVSALEMYTKAGDVYVADFYRKQEDYRSAITWYEKVLHTAENESNESKIAGVKQELAECYYLNQDFNTALDLYKELSQLNPDLNDYSFEIGKCLFALGREDEAKKYIQMKIDAGDISGYRHIGDNYKSIGDIEQAKQWYEIGAEKGDFIAKLSLVEMKSDRLRGIIHNEEE